MLRQRLWIGMALGAVAAITVLVILALRSSSPSSSAAALGSAHVTVSSAGGGTGQVGTQAPAFSATTVTGQMFHVPAGRPTVVYFMAGWCTTCLPEAGALAQIDAPQHTQVAILAVDADPTDPLSSLQNFIQQVGHPGYAFAQDDHGALVNAFGVTALDATVVIDATGKVVYRNTTPITLQTLNAALEQAGLQ